MSDRTARYAASAYSRFAGYEGNQHIASEYALEHILRVMRCWGVRSVLEIGLGIGSLSCTILEAAESGLIPQPVRYTGTESNSFCLQQFGRNLPSRLAEAVEVFPDISRIPTDRRYDLVIIDGSDNDLERVATLTSERAVFFIEGDRQPQLGRIRALFPDALAYRAVGLRKNATYGPFPSDQWSGGCHVIFVRPCLRQKIAWLAQRLMMGVKYRVRRFAATGAPTG